ncbi:MAG: hypothetical protein M5U34_09005 [Chloroflexi bacterium]|nr:hypothetical protein [Chloroflexota bacterium]
MERLGQLSESDDMALAGILSTQLVYQQFVAHPQPVPPVTPQDDVKSIKMGYPHDRP